MRIRQGVRIVALRLAKLSAVFTLFLAAYLPGESRLSFAKASLASPDVEQILEKMSPEERVGQLFLITFTGNSASEGTQIADLIANYHIGGVILHAQKDNFIDSPDSPLATLQAAQTLIRQIQEVEWNSSQLPLTDTVTGQVSTPVYIPLFIAISQEGDGYPYDQILSGLTPLPNAMAIGATWNPTLAAQVGAVAGEELVTLGFNMLLGPSLDVLESPNVGVINNLGTRSFGGDPYWVSEMGKAYIRGVHQGSQGRIAVVAKHFPGHGSADRLPEEEIATVRKSLEELQNFDLLPFLTVTGNASSADETTDALLTSHIRYQGLQGNIRATTRPFSFDPQAFRLLIDQPGLQSWRVNGGVMVTDDLGSQAVRRFYEMTNQPFDARRVSLNAFLAGNDLLYLADFSSVEDPDPYSATLRTLAFFAQKYRDDTAFAQRVDESITRILALKLRLNPKFTLDDVMRDAGNVDELGNSTSITFEVARQAATLISPSLAELEVTVPDSPDNNDFIVIVSDTRTARQCSTCSPIPQMDREALQSSILHLYGAQAGGLVDQANLASFSLEDLNDLLEGKAINQQLENDLSRANWLLFAMLRASEEIPSFLTLDRFLNERPDLLQQKRVIVFSFSAPYYLDATNISKLTALYALYDKTPQFVDVAAYLLFHELQPFGASPVSIPGIGYDLNEVLFPDPTRPIPLELDLPVTISPITTITPSPTVAPEFKLGDILPVRTGVILDHNGNPVPDNTPVSFFFASGGESSAIRQEAVTKTGVARTTFAITSSGTLAIWAESENARSEVIRFDVPPFEGELLTPTPTVTPTPTPAPTQTSILISPGTTPAPPSSAASPGFLGWLLAVFMAGAFGAAGYQITVLIGQVRWGMRLGLLGCIGGLLAYSYLMLDMPGSPIIREDSYLLPVAAFTAVGAMLGLVAGICWWAFIRYIIRPADTNSTGQSSDEAKQ